MELDINDLKKEFKPDDKKPKKKLQQPPKRGIMFPKYKPKKQIFNNQNRTFDINAIEQYHKSAKVNREICQNLRSHVREILTLPAKNKELMNTRIKDNEFMNDYIDDKLRLQLVDSLSDTYKFLCLYGVYLMESS